jgi:hypothetical protein
MLSAPQLDEFSSATNALQPKNTINGSQHDIEEHCALIVDNGTLLVHSTPLIARAQECVTVFSVIQFMCVVHCAETDSRLLPGRCESNQKQALNYQLHFS